MMNNKNILGWIIAGLVIAPAFLLYLFTPSALGHFASVRASFATLGELSGISGTLLFALTLLLSARSRFLEKIFGNLGELYDMHNKIGQVAFILLLLHPLGLLGRYAFSFADARNFFYITDNWPQNFGVLALLLMIIVIVTTLYLRPRYSIWKQIHKLIGVALFLGALHVYLIPAYVLKQNLLLHVYILAFVAVALGIWFWGAFLGKRFTEVYKYKVASTKRLNENTIEITMSPQDGEQALQYKPGQFIFISFKQKGISSESHPFSLVSTPEEGEIKIAVKALGDYTAKLYRNLLPGALAKIEGPFGHFTLEGKKDSQIWIAGGVGVTPFVSMAKSLNKRQFINAILFYSVMKESDAVYLKDFLEVAQNNPNFKVVPFYSDKQGFITAEYIKKQVGDLSGEDILLCGPPKMMQALKSQFINIGVDENNIHTEEFRF